MLVEHMNWRRLLLKYVELRRELDTWQERLGYERVATPGIEANIYCW